MTARATSHRPEFHKRAPVKTYCRVATTAAITISTALNAGDTIDGVTLAAGDRVLVKDQAAGAENGIFVCDPTPYRADDMDTSAEIVGILVYVTEGTTNASQFYVTTNTGSPTMGSTTIGWTRLSTSAPAGTFELANEGGQDLIKAHGSMGATETFDPTDGNVHTGTLNANCTFTLNAPSGSGAATIEYWLTQDGTGGWTITWPGSVTWDGGAPSPSTTAGVTVRYVLQSIDGGTNWIGDLVGGSISSFATPAIVLGTAAAAGAATTVIRSDSTIVAFDATVPTTIASGDAAATGSAAVASRRDHLHGFPSTLGAHYVIMASGISPPDPVLSSDGLDWTYSS